MQTRKTLTVSQIIVLGPVLFLFLQKGQIMSYNFERHYRIIVGIDFGTSRSGYAYAFTDSFKRDERVYGRLQWPDQHVPYPKTLTQLLYSAQAQLIAWGNSARRQHAQMQEGERTSYDLITAFKMDLYNNTQPTTEGSTGKRFHTVNLVADYLREIKKLALSEIAEKTANQMPENEILWCLTVPAIWKDVEKSFMRRAAQDAGLISDKEHDQDRLLLTLEPEAAALYCQHSSQVELPIGSSIMIIDCGGGTADITTVEVIAKGQFREVVIGGGGPYGSTSVDREFLAYLRRKLTDDTKKPSVDVFAKYIKDDPVNYQTMILERWEEIKCTFDPDKHESMNFPLPIKLYNFLKAHNPAVLDRLDKEQTEDTFVYLSRETLMQFFIPAVKGIHTQIRAQYAQLSNDRCDFIFLVGGFSASPVLRKHIRNEFGAKTGNIVSPHSPGGAIVEGAVLFGLNPRGIVSRVARRTYGCAMYRPFREGRDPTSKRHIIKETGNIYCTHRFDVFIEAGNQVTTDECVTHMYYPLESKQTSMSIRIYATQDPNPEYTDAPDVEKLGELVVNMADTSGGLDRQVRVELYFGQTELRAKAHIVRTGEEVEVSINFGGSL